MPNKENIFVYDKEGFCYRFIELHEHRCQLHGEFISSGFHAVKIKKSGKERNCCSYLLLNELNKESADRISIIYPQLLKIKE